MKFGGTVLAVFIACNSWSLQAQTLPGVPGVAIEPSRRMQGEGAEWDHEVRIALPASYATADKHYPVLWVLDGSMYFETAVRIVNVYASKDVPEMIVVAVGVPAEAYKEYQKRRSHDFTPNDVTGFTGLGSELLERELKAVDEPPRADRMSPAQMGGGAEGFLKFLVDQIRPALARDYRMTDDHTLFGDSGGGTFCTYALLARPEAFQRYICGSPALNTGDYELFRMEERYARTHKDLRARVFFGSGEAEVLEGGVVSAFGIVSSMTRMAEILRLRAYPSLELHVRIFPNENHASVIPLNLSSGLRTVWHRE